MMKIDAVKGAATAGAGGGGKVGVGVGVGLDDDMGDGMQCSDHPYRSNPGGICAFCLQEKLGKLVSSSLPLPIRASSSSPSSPSCGSEGVNGAANGGGGGGGAASSSSNAISVAGSTSKTVNFNGADCRYHDHQYQARRARIPFLLAKKKKKVVVNGAAEFRASDIVFKRSKSTTTPRRGGQYLDSDDGGDFSPRKRGGFWSFLYYHTSSKSHAPKKMDKSCTGNHNLGTNGTILEEDESPNSHTTGSASASSFERKVSRSRSVGCGSRSFSGDFFERISTGFGDCTLRRVESQRESKASKVAGGGGNSTHRNGSGVDHHIIKERVKCGGIFSGFMMTSSSSSSSSSSYLVSSSTDELNRKPTPAAGPLISGRSRSWGWAFASPMRAFKPSNSKDRKRSIIRQASENNPTPDLNAIPSLLTVRS